MKRFILLVVIAVLASAPAVVLRGVGFHPGPLMDAAIFGMAILAAGFLLSWSAEAAGRHIAQGLVLAAVALITVLPEYAVDIYYAYQAGRANGWRRCRAKLLPSRLRPVAPPQALRP